MMTMIERWSGSFGGSWAGLYLTVTAVFVAGLYAPLFVDPDGKMTFVPEAIYVWTVAFFVPYLVVERLHAGYLALRR
ncbi:MAG: hypothetical protein H6851_03100 [Geminicoccaceae bacterium]|nr:hypothetical protein [Geminicoccaceae bacterium]MCB9942601.1 hypothetical protein [Geminicoccaceae bacterium]